MSAADAQTPVQPAGPGCIDAADSPPDAVIAACTARLAAPDLAEAARADAYAVRAAMFERQGQPGPAIDDLSQAIRGRAASAPLFRKRAALYRSIGDDDRAVSDLTEAINLSPVTCRRFSSGPNCSARKATADAPSSTTGLH